MELVILRVKKLHGTLFKIRFFKLVIGAIGLGKLVAGDHIAHLGTIQRLAFTRFGKIKVSNNIRLTVELNLEPLA